MALVILSPSQPQVRAGLAKATNSQIWKLEDMRQAQWISYPALLMLTSRILDRKIVDIGQMTRGEIEKVIEDLERNEI